MFVTELAYSAMRCAVLSSRMSGTELAPVVPQAGVFSSSLSCHVWSLRPLTATLAPPFVLVHTA
eukprot:3941273-Rhodomonas_salina.3